MERIKQFIEKCDSELKKLKSENNNKPELVQMHSKLKQIETELLKGNESEERKQILKDLDSLIFIVSLMIDYYNEELGDRA